MPPAPTRALAANVDFKNCRLLSFIGLFLLFVLKVKELNHGAALRITMIFIFSINLADSRNRTAWVEKNFMPPSDDVACGPPFIPPFDQVQQDLNNIK
jgi:hypothetical protein